MVFAIPIKSKKIPKTYKNVLYFKPIKTIILSGN